MSQMFETDIASLLPAVPQTDKGHSADLRARVAQLESDQLRLLDLIEKMVELDKIKARSFDVLCARVKQLERELELDVPQPFPGQDDDFGLAPKSKTGGN